MSRAAAAGPRLAVPRHWKRSICSAVIQVISLAHYALLGSRGRASSSKNPRVRQAVKTDQLRQEIALLREEIRIKDARLARLPPNRRPHYQPSERLAILEPRAARGWSLAQTARVFQLTATTIASWTRRLDEQGPTALVQTPTPVNKFPDFIRQVVQRLQALCPRLGKVKIAQILARAGLHLGVSTVGRFRRQTPTPPAAASPAPSASRITARYPNHLWHVDLTVVPTSAGFWASWLPFALPQCWPFCWWVAICLDHYSRRAIGFALFIAQPTSEQIRHWLGSLIARVGTAPKHLVTDAGAQFDCPAFGLWCERHDITHRQGAVGKRGSIAVIERFFGTLKREGTRLLTCVSQQRNAFHRELLFYFSWYNVWRPHMTLKGATPDEVYFLRRQRCRDPRFEPRPNWPRPAPCARPQVLVKGQAGATLEVHVDFYAGRRHLPVVTILRAA